MKPPYSGRPHGHGKPSGPAKPSGGGRSAYGRPADKPHGDKHRGDGPRGDTPRDNGPANRPGGFKQPARPGTPRPSAEPQAAPRTSAERMSLQRRPEPAAPPQRTRADVEAPRGTVWLYGLHAVAAALANPARRLRRLLLTEEAEAALAARVPPPWPLAVERAERGRLDHLLGRDAVHQGAVLLADPLPVPALAAALARPGPVLVLDQVSDPRNVGAILRSAAAFGAACVIAQERNAPEETGALAKAASGALETMPLLRAVNIARTLIALKAAGFWTVGLDAGGAAAVRPGAGRAAGGAGAGRRGRGPAPAGARDLRRGGRHRHAGRQPGTGQPERLQRRGGGAVRAGAARVSAFDPRPAADALLANRAAGCPAGPLPPAIAPRDVAEGIAVQVEVARRQGAFPPGGFKLGATGSRMQAVLDLPGPAAGFMREADILASGAALPFAGFRQVQVECELAVRLARDLLPGPCTPEQAQAAVATLHAAIEVVENRYGPPPIGDLKAVGTPTLIADQVYHAACVLGPSGADWRDLDVVALNGWLTVDGVERDRGVSADLLGHPMRGLAWLAGSEAAFGFGGLRAGQAIMLGSVTPSVVLDGPCEVVVTFDGLPPARLRFT